jgi:hypothetical protein
MEVGDWWFQWDNAPVHTAAMVKVIEHLPFS